MYDSIVIGAGFGGLSAALQLAEAGKRVLLCEALKYPGGCASTFQKKGFSFEAGATLFSGFQSGQLFHKWIQKYSLPVSFESLSPTVLFRVDGMEIPIYPDRTKTLEALCSLPNAPQKQLKAFFALQKRIADILWPIFDDPHRLPPLSLDGFLWHTKRAWKYPLLLPLICTPLIEVIRKYQLDQFAPFVHYCNALCQITIQTDLHEAEAPFALCSMDYIFRGTGHIKGGIGNLAQAMVQQIQTLGGTVQMPCRVKKLQYEDGIWNVQTSKNTLQSRSVVANVLPSALQTLTEHPLPKRESLIQTRLHQGWGAVMLYLVLRNSSKLPQGAHHIQCIRDPHQKLEQGNHIFCSIGSATEQKKDAFRTATVSTHVPLHKCTDPSTVATYIQMIQSQMKQSLFETIPELKSHIVEIFPASPRTFERFTKRKDGCVGGIPRTVGMHNYRGLFPKESLPKLWLVGDSVFPGQSTLSTAIGGARTANAQIRKLK